MFSSRSQIDAKPNRLSLAIAARRASGARMLDLTLSNPTTAGFDYPLDEIAGALAAGARSRYEPEPLGLRSAREAIARHLRERGERAEPDDIVITASTSEAYSFLFKLLADPGDAILTATPSYPLLDHLAAIESARLEHFTMELDGSRWRIDEAVVSRAMHDRTRALVVVHPNNPTGSYVMPVVMEQLAAICAKQAAALISDEVFHEFPLDAESALAASAAEIAEGCLTFALGGLSKSAGLPHLKLGWIRVAGPESEKRKAIAGLELIADNFLSVATPVQRALPELLRIAPRIRDQILTRTRENRDALLELLAATPAIAMLPVEGGWSAVVRVPRIVSDEDLAIRLLERQGVLVHPGYFFDFERDGFLVVSLLTPARDFARGIELVRQTVAEVAAI